MCRGRGEGKGEEEKEEIEERERVVEGEVYPIMGEDADLDNSEGATYEKLLKC